MARRRFKVHSRAKIAARCPKFPLKHCFRSEAKAKRAARRCRARRYWYECSECGWWHLTSMEQ